jgi:hypothetical protein
VVVVIIDPDSVERREVGSGLLDVERRIDLDARGSGTATIQFGYAGISGEIKAFADIDVRMRCEFAFGTTCAAVPQGAPQVLAQSGGFAEASYQLEPGAIPGGSRDFMPWLELRLIPFAGGEPNPLAISATARPRCDTEAPGQGCVFPDFDLLAAHHQGDRAAHPQGAGGRPARRSRRRTPAHSGVAGRRRQEPQPSLPPQPGEALPAAATRRIMR